MLKAASVPALFHLCPGSGPIRMLGGVQAPKPVFWCASEEALLLERLRRCSHGPGVRHSPISQACQGQLVRFVDHAVKIMALLPHLDRTEGELDREVQLLHRTFPCRLHRGQVLHSAVILLLCAAEDPISYVIGSTTATLLDPRQGLLLKLEVREVSCPCSFGSGRVPPGHCVHLCALDDGHAAGQPFLLTSVLVVSNSSPSEALLIRQRHCGSVRHVLLTPLCGRLVDAPEI
mmetsp:Transcript_126569/g.282172  ORF Transcript_126569/g.282172 Transcript_126569/m.282172 type:complete len:233 (+) Transcript_126569:2121-2819(+)